MIAVPFGVLLVGAWLAWHQIREKTEMELARTADAAAEYTARILEGASLLADRVDDLLRDLSDGEIRARERVYFDSMRRAAQLYPYVLTLYAIDSEAHPLVSANVFPVPGDVSLADRDFFRALSASSAPALVISNVHTGRFDQELFFSVARRRGGRAAAVGAPFEGVVLASVKPNELAAGLKQLRSLSNDEVSIVRVDGAILARTAGLPETNESAGDKMTALAVTEGDGRHIERALVHEASSITASRRLANWPVIVRATRPKAEISAEWFRMVARQAFFALPASFGLLLAAALALRHARAAARSKAAVQIEAERRRAAEELRASDNRYRARLSELQSELQHASRVSSMGETASALAHELNQPLTAIVSALQAARRIMAQEAERGLPVVVNEAIERASVQALRAGQILRRVRDFLGKRETDARPEHLGALVDDAMALALIGSPHDGVMLNVAVPRDLPLVLVDRIQIQQLLVNLVRNGLEVMTGRTGAGGSAGRLDIKAALNGDDKVEVTVSDTGSGIPADVVPRLFQPFVTSKPTGMGIGLSICQSIVDAHHGRIWAEPASTGGTTFHFTLPIASGSLPDPGFSSSEVEALHEHD